MFDVTGQFTRDCELPYWLSGCRNRDEGTNAILVVCLVVAIETRGVIFHFTSTETSEF